DLELTLRPFFDGALLSMATMSATLLLHLFELLLLIWSQFGHHLFARVLAQLFEFGLLLICCERRIILDRLCLLACAFMNAFQVGFLLRSQVECFGKLLAALTTFVVGRLLRCSGIGGIGGVTAARAACVLGERCEWQSHRAGKNKS